MEYKVFVELHYINKRVRKFFIVKKVIDFTHMKRVLTLNLRLKYKKMINYKIL